MKPKSILKSKTFWLNVIGVAGFAMPLVPVTPQTFGIVMAALNVANRLITKGPVTVLGDAATEP